MMKRAGWEGVIAWGDLENSPIVNEVHDEIVLEVAIEDVDRAIEVFTNCMVSVAEKMHVGVKAVADVGVGKTWNAKA
jgi:DNA polymerase I-like protein with 3'-5' exonuclease and polymerase domains